MLKKATHYCINKNSRLNNKQTAGGALESSFTNEQVCVTTVMCFVY